MAGIAQSMKDLVNTFNLRVIADFLQTLKDYNPALKNTLIKEYKTGPVASQNYFFADFLGDLQEMTGDRKFEDMPDSYKFIISNKKWDKGVRVKEEDIERAAALSSVNQQIAALDVYRQKINELPILAKRHPVKRALTMVEAGEASTYGTCFDGQCLYDTTHAYDIKAGSQNNIVTGTGTTLAQVHADILSAIGALKGFTYTAGGSTEFLNEEVTKVMCLIPAALEPVFFQLKNQSELSAGVKNLVQGMFDYQLRPFSDANDYYVFADDNSNFKAIIHQEEVAPKLDTASPNDESVKKTGFYEYGVRYRGNQAYGAWWKTVKVKNT